MRTINPLYTSIGVLEQLRRVWGSQLDYRSIYLDWHSTDFVDEGVTGTRYPRCATLLGLLPRHRRLLLLLRCAESPRRQGRSRHPRHSENRDQIHPNPSG